MGRGRGRLARAGRALAAVGCALVAGAILDAGSAAADEVDDYQGGWVDRALGLQYELGADAPLVDAQWVATHNSYNSTAEMGQTLSAQDSNQTLAIVDQLRIDVRSIELDLHRWVSPSDGGVGPVVCHALEGGAGCTLEKPLRDVLVPIAGWLRDPENAGQVLLIYLEDRMQERFVYQRAEAIIEELIGDLVYRPPDGGCTELPLEISIDDVRAAGKQVLIVSDCNVQPGWDSVAFGWEERRQGRPLGFQDFPDCGPDHTRAQYRTHLIRYWEDATQLTAQAGTPDDGIPPATAAAMARCGVNLIGFDHITPLDGRLPAMVWSWAPGQPRAGRCALMRLAGERPFWEWGRWVSRPCRDVRRPAACLRGGAWRIVARAVPGRRAAAACRRIGAQLAVPRTGHENQRLRLRMERRGVRTAWLGYRQRRGGWRALDPR
jgi:hypothetical protein